MLLLTILMHLLRCTGVAGTHLERSSNCPTTGASSRMRRVMRTIGLLVLVLCAACRRSLLLIRLLVHVLLRLRLPLLILVSEGGSGSHGRSCSRSRR